MINLSSRLAAVAAFAENGEKIADIGTDHAYIPIYLVQRGVAQEVVASDIGDGPLERARSSAREYGVENRLTFVKADGLNGINSDFDTIIISGMGGDNIIGILERNLWSLKAERLVLQPQTRTHRLVCWLWNNGCDIRDAKLVEDSGRLYIVLLTGEKMRSGELPPAEALVPRVLLSKKDPLLERYLKEQIKKLTQATDGIKAGEAHDAPDRLFEMLDTLSGLENMLSEVKGW